MGAGGLHPVEGGHGEPRPAPFGVVAPGWYPDPFGRYPLRYWDGRTWTPHVSTGPGAVQVDPLGVAATPQVSISPPALPKPDWYQDPTGRSWMRYWDGRTWTQHVSTAPGMVAFDPLPLPTPGSGAAAPARASAAAPGAIAAPPRPDTATVATARRPGTKLLTTAGVLILVGSFLPWLSDGHGSLSAWKLPFVGLLKGRPSGGPSTGAVLLGVAILMWGVALVTRSRKAPRPAYSLLGASFALDAGVLTFVVAAKVTPHLTVGLGALLTLVGALFLLVHSFAARSRARAARTPAG